MSKLTALNQGLNRVRAFRSTARIGFALAMFVSVLLWVLMCAFVLDVTLIMGRFERFITLGLFIAAGVWAFKYYMMPALSVRESQVQLALMVEQQQGISSDLVAALQFADNNRSQFGSTDLRGAVIEYTDEVSGNLDYLEGFSRKEMSQRMIILAATVFVALLPCALATGHVTTFFSRFLLSSAHYPTRTTIDKVISPGERTAFGQAVVFKIKVGGEMPDFGIARLKSLSSGLRTEIELTPDKADPTLYVGQLERAMDDLSYTLHIGDAYTEPARVSLIPLPVVDVVLNIETPKYARGKFQSELLGNRQRVALEGSRVTPKVSSANKKLTSATITIGKAAYPMRKAGDSFILDSADNPLARVKAATIRYEVQVIDEDGLSLERPVSGILQVRADKPPRIAAATVTQYVLPGAAPRIKFRAIDDYALAKIVVHRTVVQQDTNEQGVASADQKETTTLIAEPADHIDQLGDTARVSLQDLELAKGDRVMVTLEAFDYRGDGVKGESSRSEKLVFQVTDRAGVLAAMRQLDTQMDKRLDQIIKAQLGIGDQP